MGRGQRQLPERRAGHGQVGLPLPPQLAVLSSTNPRLLPPSAAHNPFEPFPPAPSYALTPHWLGLYPQHLSQRVSTCFPLPWHSPHARVLTVKITTVLPNSQHSIPLGAHSKGQEYTSAGDTGHKD